MSLSYAKQTTFKSRYTSLIPATIVGLGLLFTAGCGGGGTSSLNSGLLTTTASASGSGTLTSGPDSGKAVTLSVQIQQAAVVGTLIFSGTMSVNGVDFPVTGSEQSNNTYTLSGQDPTNQATYTITGTATSATNLSGTAAISSSNGDSLTSITLAS